MTDTRLSDETDQLDAATFRPPRHRAELRNGSLFSDQFDDRFGSDEDPVAESRHVFIEGNSLLQRWQQCADRTRFTVGEIGFGSGLNFLNTSAEWLGLDADSRPRYLHYIGFEQFPLEAGLIEQVLVQHFAGHPLLQPLLSSYSELCQGSYRRWLAPDVVLDLHIGDAEAELAALDSALGIDAWYLDGFSPATNPALWQSSLFQQLARLSSNGATCSSYSAAGAVRRELQAQGFSVERHEGFGRKRHMSRAVRHRQTESAQGPSCSRARRHSPWYRSAPPRRGMASKAIVVGAGIAGCSTALALARRGIQVQLLDAAGSAASGASGIPQLALRPRLYRQRSHEGQFYLNAFLQARAFYRDLNSNRQGLTQSALEEPGFWQELAIIQMADALNKSRPSRADDYTALYPASVLTREQPEALSQLAQIPLYSEGLVIRGGRLFADAFCRFCIDHSRVEFLPHHRLVSMSQTDGGWKLRMESGDLLSSETVVLATAAAAGELPELGWLQLEQLLGQTSTIASSAASAALRVILSGPKTLFPADGSGKQLIAATYEAISGGAEAMGDRTKTISDSVEAVSDSVEAVSERIKHKDSNHAATLHPSLDRRRENHLENIDGSLLHFGLASKQACDGIASSAEAKFACRATALDRLPVIGPVPKRTVILERYAELARNAATDFPDALPAAAGTASQYQPGLYVNAAHGSYGAITAAYGAEIIASQICGEAEPAGAQILDLVSPTRFLIRDLRRQTTAIKEGSKRR